MNFPKVVFILLMFLSFTSNASVLSTMLSELESEAGTTFSADKGKTLWFKDYVSKKDGKNRNCTICHTNNLKNVGQHKKIDPLAVSVTRDRLTDRKKINKGFKRNCKWTIGRECTAEEKGHFLMYINSQ